MLKLVLFLSVLGKLGGDAAPTSSYSTTSLSGPTSSLNTTVSPLISPSSSSTSSVKAIASSSTPSSVKTTSSSGTTPSVKAASPSSETSRVKTTSLFSTAPSPSAAFAVKAASSTIGTESSKATSPKATSSKATSSFNITSRINATSSSSRSSATKTPIPPPTAKGAGATSECYRWHVARKDDRCLRVEEQYDIPHKTFVGLNPEINDNCTNLYNGDSYCVSGRFADSSSTATTRVPEITATKGRLSSVSSLVYTFTSTGTGGGSMTTRNSTTLPTGSSKGESKVPKNNSKDPKTPRTSVINPSTVSTSSTSAASSKTPTTVSSQGSTTSSSHTFTAGRPTKEPTTLLTTTSRRS